MRKGILLLSLLMLAFVPQAQLNTTEFVTPYLYNWESYPRDVNVISANLPSGNYSIIVINNTYTFLLNMSDRIYFVESQAAINPILRQYYASEVYPKKDELDSLNSSFQSFMASRGNAERDCYVETGLETPDGKPLFTCTYSNVCESCHSVPVCRDTMAGTATTPDPMSSPLAQAILVMSADLPLFNGNLSIFNYNIANINNSSDVAKSLNAMSQSLTSIRSIISDMGKEPVSIIYEQYIDNLNPNAIGFCMNFYKVYNLTALDSAVSKAKQLSARVPTESTLEGQISSIYNRTQERKLNRTIREDREKFDAFYATLLSRRDNLTARAALALSHISDNETTKELASLDKILAQIRTLGDARNYAAANALSSNFSSMANSTELHVASVESIYNNIIELNSTASDIIYEAQLYTPQDDFITQGTIDHLATEKESIAFTIRNSSPLSFNDAKNLSEELQLIKSDASALVNEKSSVSSQGMDNIIAVIAKPVVILSLNTLNSFTPLSYADREKNASTIIAVMFVIADLLILAVSLGAFFYFVHAKRIELHNVAKILWAFIFAFFFILLALLSFAVYNVANLQSHPTTFGPFLSELKGSSDVTVVAQLTGVNGTLRNKMINCSGRIVSALSSMQKNVVYYTYNDKNCQSGNDTRSVESCNEAIDAHPVIVLQSTAATNSTFIVFYTEKATFEGDVNFFSDCAIARLLG